MSGSHCRLYFGSFRAVVSYCLRVFGLIYRREYQFHGNSAFLLVENIVLGLSLGKALVSGRSADSVVYLKLSLPRPQL